jgi:Cap4-like dsDNA endonuclease family protein
VSSPIDKRDKSDPGDEVLRKFRYQFAYGVILLIGAASRRLDYCAIWCEQYEDFLAEISDQNFDAYQVKTRKPELGAWELNDEAMWKSIARFAELDQRYPGKIRFFKFVSNAEYSDSSAVEREHLSPIKLLTAVRVVRRWDELSGPAKKGFVWLKEKNGATAEELLAVLSRLELISGPTERAFEDELAQSHISSLAECSTLSASALARVRDSLIAMVAEASSLFANDPARHWVALNRDRHDDPLLLAKRITIEDLTLSVRDARGGAVEYLPSLASLQLGSASKKMDTLQKKMVRGGLAHHYEMMRRRTLSAEQTLLDLATRPDDLLRICSQLENVVFGECDDSRLRACQHPEPFGTEMLIDVQDRLKRLTQAEPERVYHQHYDLLVGVAGLLASECKVWWSQPFQVEEAE